MQAKGQLWPTRAFSAECAQYKQQVSGVVINTSQQEGKSMAHVESSGSFPRKELPDRAEDRSLLCKGAAERRHFTEESFRPLRGLGFLRGALIQSQNQIS